MMQFYVGWMSKRPVFNALLVVAYYIIVVAPHKKFGTFLNTVVFKGITRDQYNLYVIIGASLVLFLYGLFFFKESVKQVSRNRMWFYMAANILLTILIINFLFVINIEVIHFPQYAAFAILIYPMIRNYNSTLIWTTIAGSIDEAYQNFYLAPKDTGYYDWNDVITNLVGAIFGLLLLRSFNVKQRVNNPWYQSSGLFGLLSLCGLVFLLWLSGFLSIYPSDTSTIQMVTTQIEGFWHKVPPNVVFHVVKPLEGFTITLSLFAFYNKIGN